MHLVEVGDKPHRFTDAARCGRVDPAAAGRVGESMRLVADLNQMHLIDPRTELVI